MKLDCPAPDCRERFYDVHDESAVTTLVYHLKSKHEPIYTAIHHKLTQ